MSDFVKCSLCGGQGTAPPMRETLLGHVCPICADEAHRQPFRFRAEKRLAKKPGAAAVEIRNLSDQEPMRIEHLAITPRGLELGGFRRIEDLPHDTFRHGFDVDDGERGSRQPAPHVTQQGAATPGQGASSAAGNVAEPRLAPGTAARSEDPSSTPPSSGFRRPTIADLRDSAARALREGREWFANRDDGVPLSQLERYGHNFIPPSGQHDETCAFVCDATANCQADHSCTVCDEKARKEGRIP